MSVPDIEIYVRFCETDAAGHVNNISYYIYLEEARTKFFDFIEMPKIRKQYPFLQLLVASSHCNYYKQAYSKQILAVTTTISRVGNKSFSMVHEIKDAKADEIIAIGGATMVCFHREKQQSIDIPSILRLALENYENKMNG